MDDIVKQAMVKWPNVPHCYGWLGLDARGNWYMRDDKLQAAGTRFIIEPHIRFKGLPGEQATMFFLDPSGNALEFKAFGDMAQVFAK